MENLKPNNQHQNLDKHPVLKAPNGLDSKLTQGQWHAVRTAAFKDWFGDWENDPENSSKAIDRETGEPQVYYHGSGTDFDKFISLGERENDPEDNHGIYFSPNAEAAGVFAQIKSERIKDGAANIQPVFISIQNPKIVASSRHFTKAQMEEIVNAGHDGVIEEAQWEGTSDARYFKDQIVVVFSNEQIKSAIGNSGQYSNNSQTTL